VRFGFIEMVDDREVAAALLQAVERWGAQRGMTRIQGPLGITDFDKEGMLVEDFDLRGSMTAIYNPPYYPQHLEAMGYTKEVDWLQVRIQVPDEVPSRFHRVAEYARTQFGLRVRKLTAKELRGEYALRVFALLNEAYSPLFGFTEFTPDQVREFIKKYLPLVDLRMMPVVENPQGEIVGVAVTMQSMAKALQQSRGRLLPLGWLHLLRALRNNHEDSAEMLLVAVRPDYQDKGINALFFQDQIPIINDYGIRILETTNILETNTKNIANFTQFDHKIHKRHRAYIKTI
jgi:GNAT superfamily N-acetyltransferase